MPLKVFTNEHDRPPLCEKPIKAAMFTPNKRRKMTGSFNDAKCRRSKNHYGDCRPCLRQTP